MFIIYSHIHYVNNLNQFFQKNLEKMSHNVPAVYDVLVARIRALRSKDQGRQNVAEVLRGNERSE
jgi:hypothetical protein